MLAHNILHHKLSLKGYCLVTITTGHTLIEERPFLLLTREWLNLKMRTTDGLLDNGVFEKGDSKTRASCK
jgi:hypothetical protein